VKLKARLPFAGHAVLDFLRARAIPGVEVVGTDTYERVTTPLRLRVRSDGIDLLDGNDVARVRDLFDLDADGRAIDEHLSRDPKMRALVKKTPGVRVPGAFDGFELAVRTVLGQQVSVAAATTLCARLALAFGPPRADVLANAHVDDVARIGVPKSRAATLIEIARAVHAREVTLEPGADVAGTIATLVTLKGIGPWTAKYIAMRALGARDVFLEEDLVIRKRVGRASLPATVEAASKRAQRWAPYRSYAVLRLWKSAADAAK
jgi:AraC family transcriptional regulator, regulatory protein of adaptative response / DNA-3-methyladenine glycosylase II